MRLLRLENINNILFIDIETAPQWQTLDAAPEYVQKEWIYKFKFREGAPKPPDPNNSNSAQDFVQDKYYNYFKELWTAQAGLFPEFSKVIVISAGYMDGYNFKLKSYSHDKEADLLKSFSEDLTAFNKYNKYLKLCAHFGKGFDYPFLAKRLLIHRQILPDLLDSYGLKPWEGANLDTQEIWKIGGYGSGGTLSSIAMAFGIPTPKDDIGGAEVAGCYYNGELQRITTYCEKDVFTLLNVFKAMRGEELLKNECIQFVN